MNDRADADPRIGVDLEAGRGVQRPLAGMFGEVGHPHVEQIGEEGEERPRRIQFADLVFHVRPHALAADVGDVGVQVALVGEVLEEAAFGHARTACDDVEAAAGEAVRGELGLRGGHHRGPAFTAETGPGDRGHRASQA